MYECKCSVQSFGISYGQRIEREATFRYQTLTLNNDNAVNCLSVNNFLIFRAECLDAAEVFKWNLRRKFSSCVMNFFRSIKLLLMYNQWELACLSYQNWEDFSHSIAFCSVVSSFWRNYKDHHRIFKKKGKKPLPMGFHSSLCSNTPTHVTLFFFLILFFSWDKWSFVIDMCTAELFFFFFFKICKQGVGISIELHNIQLYYTHKCYNLMCIAAEIWKSINTGADVRDLKSCPTGGQRKFLFFAFTHVFNAVRFGLSRV